MLSLFGTISVTYTYIRSDKMCEDFVRNNEYYSVGVVFLGLCCIAALLLMF
jgi:hypothetical protein